MVAHAKCPPPRPPWREPKNRERKEHKQKDKKEKKEKRMKRDATPEKVASGTWEEPRETVNLKLVKELAPQLPWQYPFWDDSRRAYTGVLKSQYSRQQCMTLFDTIKGGTEWLQPVGSKGIMPRKTAWMVNQGCECKYHYGPFEVPPAIYPSWMLELMQDVMPKCGLSDPDSWPDCCNMNLYEDGGAGVGWHSDDEALFQGKFRDILIVSFSLGVARKFELRHCWPDETVGEGEVFRTLLGNGDLMTMEGMCQKHMQHRVPKEEYVQGPRINLTWRWIVKHTPQCPAKRRR